MRGDLQEGHVYDKRLCGYASRCQFPLFPVPIPLLPSTKTPFLCFFGLQNPHFQAFQAQNWGFCAFLAFETLVFSHFEHKIEVFVLFWPSGPSFSGVSSTKSRFLCAFAGGWSPTCGRRLRKEGRHTGHEARDTGQGPEMKARCQNCGHDARDAAGWGEIRRLRQCRSLACTCVVLE